MLGRDTPERSRRWLAVPIALLAAFMLITMVGPASGAETSIYEAEAMSVPRGKGAIVKDASASAERGLALMRTTTASGKATMSPGSRMVVRARGDQCVGAPRMVVKVNGKQVSSLSVVSVGWQDYGVDLDVPSGSQAVTISFANDYSKRSTCDRNLYVDKLGFTPKQTTPPAPDYVFGMVGADGTHLAEERAAGVDAQVVRLSWREWYPKEGVTNASYVGRKKEELAKLRAAGFTPVLTLGLHDTPPWVHENYADTRYVDQFGREYLGDTFVGGRPIDNGDANLIFNDQLRGLASSWTKEVFSELGTDFYAVRLGGGRWGELTYPPATYGGKSNLYWSFDANARARNPAPGWTPGNPSPNGEAKKFLEWHLASLAEYQNWQVGMVREAGYGGRAMMLYPSWGIRPGQAAAAAAANLSGTTSAEKNGEVQRGFDFERQVKAVSDGKVVVTTTWLDAPLAYASVNNPTPVEYLSGLAKGHPLGLEVYGENTGRGSAETMKFSASQMKKYDLSGMVWYRESEMFSGSYATLADYRLVMDTYRVP